jgi:PqqD family protein of HPr-rel-A system
MTANPVRRDDLEINPVADGYVVYDPARDQVHFLNQTAALVLEFCDGDETPAGIAESVRAVYRLDEPVDEQVAECIERLRREGLITVG